MIYRDDIFLTLLEIGNLGPLKRIAGMWKQISQTRLSLISPPMKIVPFQQDAKQ